MTKINLRRLLLVGGTMAAAAWAGGASAQDGAGPPPVEGGQSVSSLEEIVVTARRRAENLQTTPVTITAVTAETMEARNVTTLAKIAEIAPNMSTFKTAGALGSAGNYIRGIGAVDNVLGQDPPIGIYMDGVYIGRNNVALMQLVEPERVEVLRGAQGTLFGRNTTGGAISITTRTPADEFGGQAKASYGTFKANSFQARIDSGLLGDSGVKLSGAYQHRQQDGVVDNKLQPSNLDPGAFKSDSFWFKAAGEWGGLTANLSADYSELTGVPDYFQIIGGTAATLNMLAVSPSLGGDTVVVSRTAQDQVPSWPLPGTQHVWSEGVALTLNYEINENLDIKSISAVRAYKRNDPTTYGPANLRANIGTVASPVISTFPGGIYAVSPRNSSQRQFTQEFQVLGSMGDFEYVLGAFYLRENAWEISRTRAAIAQASGTTINNQTGLDYSIHNKSYAGFAQANWRPAFLDKKLELTGGVRWTRDKKGLVQNIPVVRAANLNRTNTSFLASANYQWTPDFMTYARFATGYRAGGFNVRAAAGITVLYKPERLKSWEGGFKFEGLDHRLRLNGAAFYNKYRDLQVVQFSPPSLGGNAVGSAAINADAHYPGFELELEAVPVDRLTISASVGYVAPKYDTYPVALLTGGVVGAGCAAITANNATVGQDCARVAKVTSVSKTTANAGVTYVFAPTSYGEWSIRADYSYKGRYEWSAINLPSTPFQQLVAQKAYGVLSARLALSDIPLSGNARAQLSVYGENLTDKRYLLQGLDFGFMANGQFSAGRTVGVDVKVEF
jgi:iron complex outermembrane receptor protein